jgi:hypothetical protein
MSSYFLKYKEARADGRTSHASHVEFIVDNIIAIAVKPTYTVDLAAHQFISDIGGSNEMSRSSVLTSKAVTNGRYFCDNFVFTIASSGTIADIIIAMNTGVDATSPLMGFINAGTTLPLAATAGIPVNVTVDPGAYGLMD